MNRIQSLMKAIRFGLYASSEDWEARNRIIDKRIHDEFKNLAPLPTEVEKKQRAFNTWIQVHEMD